MKQRAQGSTDYPITFLLVDETDHLTGKTGLTPTVEIAKNGTPPFAAPLGAVTEIGYGWYRLAGNATDRNTLGEFLIHVEAPGADVMDDKYAIVPYSQFAVALSSNTIQWNGSTPSNLVNGSVVSTPTDSVTPMVLP